MREIRPFSITLDDSDRSVLYVRGDNWFPNFDRFGTGGGELVPSAGSKAFTEDAMKARATAEQRRKEAKQPKRATWLFGIDVDNVVKQLQEKTNES